MGDILFWGGGFLAVPLSEWFSPWDWLFKIFYISRSDPDMETLLFCYLSCIIHFIFVLHTQGKIARDQPYPDLDFFAP